MRPSKQRGRDDQRELRFEIERCFTEGLAVFPYSEIHLLEAANVTDPESRSEQIRFWNNVSGGYRFHDARTIELMQLEGILKGRSIRFARDLAIHRSQITFEEELPEPDLKAKAERADRFRDLVRYWASKVADDLKNKVRYREVDGLLRLISEDLSAFMKTGVLPMNRVFSKHNDLHSELCWHFRRQGSSTVWEDAYAWLKGNALTIPSLLVDFVGTEIVAEQFASDLQFRRKVENAEADHDANDLEAAAHWFLYADHVFADKKMVTFLFPQLRRVLLAQKGLFELPSKRPRLFSSRAEFSEFIRAFRATETVLNLEDELRVHDWRFKTLVYRIRTSDPLISRETISRSGTLEAEVLPGGGLRIDALNDQVTWDEMASCFQKLLGWIDEDGKAATITTAEWQDGRPRTRNALLTLGTLSLQIDDIRGELHCKLSPS